MRNIDFYRIGRAITHFETYGYKRVDIPSGTDISTLMNNEGMHLYVLHDQSTFRIRLLLVSCFKITDITKLDKHELENFNNLVDYDVQSLVRTTRILFNNEKLQVHIDKEHDYTYVLRDKHTNELLSNFSFVRNGDHEAFIGMVLEEPLFEDQVLAKVGL